jgi:hypothetical protein
MDIMELGALGDFLSSIGVIVTLLYLSVQIKQHSAHQKQVAIDARAVAVHTSAAALRENRKAIYQDAEFAEIYFKGLSSPESLSEIEYLRFRILMQNVIDGLWDIHSRTAVTGASPEIWHSLGVKAIERMLATQGGRLVWSEMASAYPIDFRTTVESVLVDL